MIDGLVSVLTDSGWRHDFAGGNDIEVTVGTDLDRAPSLGELRDAVRRSGLSIPTSD